MRSMRQQRGIWEPSRHILEDRSLIQFTASIYMLSKVLVGTHTNFQSVARQTRASGSLLKFELFLVQEHCAGLIDS